MKEFFQSQKESLTREIKIQEQLKIVLEREQNALTKYKEGVLEDIVVRKELLLAEAKILSEKRREAIESFNCGKTLSECLASKGSSIDKRELGLLIKKFTNIAKGNHSLSKEVGLLGTFASSIAGSLIGIFHSAKQGVSEHYTGKGQVNKSYHPRGGRSSSGITKA